jgi:hypothetical protein
VAALLSPANALAVLAGSVASLWTVDFLPLLASAAGAAVYAVSVSVSPLFRRVVARNVEAQALTGGRAESASEALLAELSPSQRQHYEILRGVCDDILNRYQQMPGGRVLAASSSTRLDALLSSFVRLVSTLNSYRTFLNSADRKVLAEELAQL